jgi:hypothetical protein
LIKLQYVQYFESESTYECSARNTPGEYFSLEGEDHSLSEMPKKGGKRVSVADEYDDKYEYNYECDDHDHYQVECIE